LKVYCAPGTRFGTVRVTAVRPIPVVLLTTSAK
jgi:hypothetical protein